MKVMLEKPADPNRFGGTFPLTADLDEDLVKSSKIGASLKRIARQLCKQFKKKDGKIIGVNFHALEFSFILEPKKDE